MQDTEKLSTNMDATFHLDRLSLWLAKARAMAAVATMTDFSEYDPIVASDYWNTVLGVLDEAQLTHNHVISALACYRDTNFEPA